MQIISYTTCISTWSVLPSFCSRVCDTGYFYLFIYCTGYFYLFITQATSIYLLHRLLLFIYYFYLFITIAVRNMATYEMLGAIRWEGGGVGFDPGFLHRKGCTCKIKRFSSSEESLYFFLKNKEINGGSVAKCAGVVIRSSRVQGLHPGTNGICFSVVPSSNPRSRFVNSQLVCLLPVGIFNYVMFIWNVCFLCFSGMPVN